MSLAEGTNNAAISESLIMEEHIPQLTELLVGCAHKWENISIALGLPERVRKDLRAKQDPDCIVCFNQVLTEWVLGGYEHARAPTLENLEAVLKSKIVGLATEAQKLHGVDIDKLLIRRKRPLLPMKQCLEPLPLEIIKQTRDTTVSEGKSTLLEIQAVTSKDVYMTYKWLKDGHELNETSYGNILCITSASISSKGTYECDVSISGDKSTTSISSSPIALTVTLSTITTTLVTRYLKEPEVPEDSWSQARSNTYINLALIKQGDIGKAGEYGRNTVQGNVDDILKDKERIEYENTFTNLKSAVCLLIEGRPGSGKTTLVHKFSRDWASGNPKLQLHNIKLLFLVPLRSLFNAPFGLQDIVKLYYTHQPTVDQVVQEAEENNGEGLCIILDGLDEYQPESMKQTFVYRLIKKQVLTNSIVIVASRPAASYRFRSVASKQIELIGFLKQQIISYIENYPFRRTDIQSLRSYLDHHPNVLHMCYLPIHAAMVCYLFKHMSSSFPQTETEIYKEFTTLTLLRTLTRNDSETESQCETFESAEDLPDTEKKVFSEICELSFKKTVSSKQVMRRAEVKGFFRNVNSGNESLGLITVDRMSKKHGFENVYTFLHLTFQEYLAAYHLFELEEQLSTLKELTSKQHMQVVLKFFCGLTSFSEKDIRLVEILSMKEDNLFGVQCAFESQQSVVCDYVVESGEHGTLSFKDHFLTPSDLTAIGYVMKTATCPVEKLVLDNCVLSQEGITTFFDKAGEKVLSVKMLCFHGISHKAVQYKMLHSFIKKLNSIEILDLSNTILTKNKIDRLTKNTTLPNLHTLKLSSTTGTSYIDQSSLHKLHFNSPKFHHVVIDTNHYKHTETFFSNPSFLHLYGISKQEAVDVEGLQVTDIKLVADGLKQGRCTMLKLSYCNISADSARYLTRGLKHCSSFQRLELDYNNISESGAEVLAQGLRRCHNFKALNVVGSGIGGKKLITECLQRCNRLEELALIHNHITDDSAKALTRALQLCSSDLMTLDFSWNNISHKGAKALAKGLRCCTCLLTLDLSGNIILVMVLRPLLKGCNIAKVFKHCVSLQQM